MRRRAYENASAASRTLGRIACCHRLLRLATEPPRSCSSPASSSGRRSPSLRRVRCHEFPLRSAEKHHLHCHCWTTSSRDPCGCPCPTSPPRLRSLSGGRAPAAHHQGLQASGAARGVEGEGDGHEVRQSAPRSLYHLGLGARPRHVRPPTLGCCTAAPIPVRRAHLGPAFAPPCRSPPAERQHFFPLRSIAGKDEADKLELLRRCASTTLNSKLVAGEKDFFSKMARTQSKLLLIDPRQPSACCPLPAPHTASL